MNPDSIEEAVKTLELNAPRVTSGALASNIAAVEYVTHITQAGKVLRWAVITTRCGFAVTGKPSAAVSAENDNAALGEQIALDNAKGELWGLMGYALAETVYRGTTE